VVALVEVISNSISSPSNIEEARNGMASSSLWRVSQINIADGGRKADTTSLHIGGVIRGPRISIYYILLLRIFFHSIYETAFGTDTKTPNLPLQILLSPNKYQKNRKRQKKMRQYRERELTGEEEKTAGRRWLTRQIICLVDRKEVYNVLKRLSALGQIDDMRALCISDERRAAMTVNEVHNIWDLFIAVTYRELASSTSCLAAYEFAESWMYTTVNSKKHNVAKFKHHDVETPGIGVKPAVILPESDQQGYSCSPLRTRSLLFTNPATGQPIDVSDYLVAQTLKAIWLEVTHDIRLAFRNEIEDQSEWALAVNSDWTRVYDMGVFYEKEQPGLTTWESVEVARLLYDRCRSLRLSDGRVVTAQWAEDPVLKDFFFEDTVREVIEGEEDEIAQERSIRTDCPLACEGESEEE